MSKMRQDAWTKDEDILLAETVLRFIRNGKTQLDAFKQVGEHLSRTPAACGFRWNATVRHQYREAINVAKKNRKQVFLHNVESNENIEHETIATAISLLEKVQQKVSMSELTNRDQLEKKIEQLSLENIRLKERIKTYQEAWVALENFINSTKFESEH